MTVSQISSPALQLTTFYIGDQLLGVPIDCVQEIIRNLSTTRLPHAPPHVCGVINLRGEVATVLDLSLILGYGPSELKRTSRNMIVRTSQEPIGLWVERVADIISAPVESITQPPGNIIGTEARFFRGVYQLRDEIVVILNLDEILNE